MKNSTTYLKRIVSVGLLLTVMLASINWRVGMHLCCGNIVSVALFSNAENCGMSTDAASCEEGNKSANSIKNSCCQDKLVKISSVDTLRRLVAKISEIGFVLPVYFASYFNIYLTEVGEIHINSNTDPPPWTFLDLETDLMVYLI